MSGKCEDRPHLFLEKPNGRFDHFMLPEGLPARGSYQHKAVHADNDLKKSEKKKHFRDGGLTLPIPNYNNRSAKELTRAVVNLSLTDLEQVKRYEESHKRLRRSFKPLTDNVERRTRIRRHRQRGSARPHMD